MVIIRGTTSTNRISHGVISLKLTVTFNSKTIKQIIGRKLETTEYKYHSY